MKKYIIACTGVLTVVAVAYIFLFSAFAKNTDQKPPASDVATEPFSIQPVASTSTGAVHIPIIIYHSVRPDFATCA